MHDAYLNPANLIDMTYREMLAAKLVYWLGCLKLLITVTKKDCRFECLLNCWHLVYLVKPMSSIMLNAWLQLG